MQMLAVHLGSSIGFAIGNHSGSFSGSWGGSRSLPELFRELGEDFAPQRIAIVQSDGLADERAAALQGWADDLGVPVVAIPFADAAEAFGKAAARSPDALLEAVRRAGIGATDTSQAIAVAALRTM